MSETQTACARYPDFVDLAFARRLEMAETMTADCAEAVRRATPTELVAWEQIAGGTAFFGGVTYPANQIVGLGLYGEVTAEALDQVEHFYRSRGVPTTIVVSPLADRSLLELLGPRGYTIAEFNSVLILRIAPDEPFTPPGGIVIEAVTPATRLEHARVVAAGFSELAEVPEEVFVSFSVVPHALAYLARVDGVAAGGAGGRIIAEAGIAALYGTATLPAYRRRGIQSALIARRLYEAAQHGCEYAVVSTQPGSGSQRNMERRGFRLAYTKLVMTRP